MDCPPSHAMDMSHWSYWPLYVYGMVKNTYARLSCGLFYYLPQESIVPCQRKYSGQLKQYDIHVTMMETLDVHYCHAYDMVDYNPTNIFALCYWPKRVRWPNIPQLKLGNIWGYSRSSLLRTDNVRGPTSKHIFAPHGGYCLCTRQVSCISYRLYFLWHCIKDDIF